MPTFTCPKCEKNFTRFAEFYYHEANNCPALEDSNSGMDVTDEYRLDPLVPIRTPSMNLGRFSLPAASNANENVVRPRPTTQKPAKTNTTDNSKKATSPDPKKNTKAGMRYYNKTNNSKSNNVNQGKHQLQNMDENYVRRIVKEELRIMFNHIPRPQNDFHKWP